MTTIYEGLALFFVLFLFSFWGDYIPTKKRASWLVILFLSVVIMIGVRNPHAWIDTVTYGKSFMNTTKTLLTFSFSDKPYGYTEKGYYFLCVIAKTISNTYFFYFSFIGFLSMFFIFKSLQKFCLMPFLGFFIYAGRFLLGRDFNQVRGGLAIAILIFATVYLTRRKVWHYLACILIAYTIHTSALIAIPFYLINLYKFKKWHIYVGLVLAFLIAGFFGSTVKSLVSGSEWVQQLARSYVDDDSVKAWANDLTNPMIYYQCLVLITFTILEKRLSRMSAHYYTLRNAYFYSTLLLIILCQYGIVASRTSTIFATYEIIIIPMIILTFKRTQRLIPYFILFLFNTVFFIKNWPGTNFGL